MVDLVALRAANANRWAHAKLTLGPEFSAWSRPLQESVTSLSRRGPAFPGSSSRSFISASARSAISKVATVLTPIDNSEVAIVAFSARP
jgi:hypothetical protein